MGKILLYEDNQLCIHKPNSTGVGWKLSYASQCTSERKNNICLPDKGTLNSLTVAAPLLLSKRRK